MVVNEDIPLVSLLRGLHEYAQFVDDRLLYHKTANLGSRFVVVSKVG